ncbi:MAG: Hpt domain-containing protein [Planctomycetaceae bacterium]|nr:Hpt domain-containing protein [Planctomycetaceae bacterium]
MNNDNYSGPQVPADPTAAIDWKDLYNRIPDEALIIQFAASFKENTHSLIEKLDESLRQNNIEQIEANAHALKGAAANLGAVLLAKAAWQLEYAARNRQCPQFHSQMQAIHSEYAGVMELLAQPNWIELAKTYHS